MKILWMLILTFLSFQLVANDWQKALSCEDDRFIIDRGSCTPKGCPFQLVIRNSKVISYLIEKWAISLDEVNDRGEFLMPMTRSNYQDKTVFFGETNWSPQGRNEVVVAFKEGQVWLDIYFIYGHGHSLGKERIADWYFPSCTLL